MSAQDKRCTDICYNDLTSVEVYTVALFIHTYVHMSSQTGIGTGQPQKCSENVRCLTVISCPVCALLS